MALRLTLSFDSPWTIRYRFRVYIYKDSVSILINPASFVSSLAGVVTDTPIKKNFSK